MLYFVRKCSHCREDIYVRRGVEMKKHIGYLLILMMVMLCMISCSPKKEIDSKTPAPSLSTSTPTPQPSVEPTITPLPTPIPKEAKKTIEECLRGLLRETPEEHQAKYFREGKIKYNKLSDWKDAKGNYHYPKGYEINYYIPSDYNLMVAQQMPQALLDEISTEELYQLIMSLPGDWVSHWIDTYLQMVERYYVSYNFMTNFMRRKDSAKVVHHYYQNYSKEDRSKYTINRSDKNYRKGYKDTKAERAKQQRFLLTEGLEWFYRYKDGKTVPNEHYLGLGCMGHY